MTLSPIDEIKQIRHKLGADAGFDVSRIFADLREQHRTSSRTYVDTSNTIADNHAIDRSGEAMRSEVENPSPPPGDR